MADYIDRQAAIKAIDDYINDICSLGVSCWNGPIVANEIRDIILELPSPWVSVEDRPPEKAGVYMACIAAEDPDVRVVDTAWYDQDRKTWLDAGRYRTVTHWMHQPDMPKMVGVRNADQSGASYADKQTLAEA